MKSPHKLPTLAAATLAAALASNALASFNYDLRLAPGQTAFVVNAHEIVAPIGPTTYTLQLWAQITGDNNLTNDGYINGFVGIQSVEFNGGAWTGGGGITSATLGQFAQAPVGAPNAGSSNTLTDDGIADWGGTSTSSTNGWLKWVGGANSGFLDGTAFPGQSQQVNANTWEILIATFTLNVGLPIITFDPSPQGTTLQVVTPNFVKNGIANLSGLNYTQDGAATPTSNGETSNSFTVDAVYLVGPEPASLSLLSLASLPLLTRRRRTL